MRRLVFAVGIAFFVSGTAARAEEVVIHIENFTYSPPALTIKSGTKVTWVNDDDIPHLIVENDGKFHSEALDTGDKFSMTFSESGNIAYYCALHPHMKGTITVAPGTG